MSSQSISFSDPNVQRCPFPQYETIRAQGPVYCDPGNGWYIVTSYELVREILNDPQTYSSVTGQLLVQESPHQATIDAVFAEEGYLPINVLVVSDPPEHNFYRSLVDKTFTPSRVRQMEDYLSGVVDEMIDAVIDNGQVEFYGQIANMIPMAVIADQIGVPRDDIEKFKLWSRAVLDQAGLANSLERQLEITRAIAELQRYIAARAEEYLVTPRECMLNDLVHADINGRKVTMRELVAIVLQLLVAGNDTTTSVMSSCIYRIVREPGLEDRLRANPAEIPTFVEEVLRMEAPVQGLWRRVTRDIELAGVKIPAGSLLLPKFGAANRDPTKFACPGQFDMDRKGVRNHLTFGAGIHHCIGNQLARGELRVAINKLLTRLKNFRLTYGEDGVEFIAHIFNYGPHKLHISFDRN